MHLVAPGKNGSKVLGRSLLAPLNLMYLAACTPGEASISIIDESVESVDLSDPPDLVGITTLTATARRAYEIAGLYRRVGAKVVLGGVHASALPRARAEKRGGVSGALRSASGLSGSWRGTASRLSRTSTSGSTQTTIPCSMRHSISRVGAALPWQGSST